MNSTYEVTLKEITKSENEKFYSNLRLKENFRKIKTKNWYIYKDGTQKNISILIN